MYEFENKEKESVKNASTGEMNIRPGTWKWQAYVAWQEAGGVTKDFVEDLPAKEKEIKAQAIHRADIEASQAITFQGKQYRATAIDRARIAMALSISYLPYIELVLIDGTMQYTIRDTLVEIANLILQRDQDIYGRIAAELAKVKE